MTYRRLTVTLTEDAWQRLQERAQQSYRTPRLQAGFDLQAMYVEKSETAGAKFPDQTPTAS